MLYITSLALRTSYGPLRTAANVVIILTNLLLTENNESITAENGDRLLWK